MLLKWKYFNIQLFIIGIIQFLELKNFKLFIREWNINHYFYVPKTFPNKVRFILISEKFYYVL